MRHWLGSVVTWALAAFLVMGATSFAWLRSTQVTVTDEQTVAARHEPAPAHEFDWRELGRASYARNCSNCHRLAGQGWDQYPSLTSVAEQALAPGGREYLLDLHIYGLDGPRRVPMPPMGHIPPAELAAVINHVLTNFGNEQVEGVELFAPDDVRARLGQRLSPRDVYEQRRPAGTAGN